MSIQLIEWMQDWVAKNCNGDWEHNQNFTITTIDNPGWSITVNLVDTDLEEKHFTTIDYDKSETDWYYCRVKNGRFEADGGIRNLVDMIHVFINWAES